MLEFDLHVRRPGFAFDVAGSLDQPLTGVFGPSGAGKSTLLACLAGLVRPDDGRVTLDNRVLVDTRRGRWLPPHRRRVGMVFQDLRLLPHLTARGNLEFARRYAPDGASVVTFDDIVDLLEIGPLLDQAARSLSGGERQRVALARAVLAAPEVLLLDEPLASLDPRLRHRILPFLQQLQRATGVPMLYVSHDINEILALTDTLLLLDHGQVRGHGPYHDLVARTEVLDGLRGQDLVNVMAGRVLADQPLSGGVTFQPDGWTGNRGLIAPPPTTPGSRHAFILTPDDITLSRKQLDSISIQNQIAGRVVAVDTFSDQVICRLDCDGLPLLAEVTPAARDKLQIACGQTLWCLFKTRAISWLPTAPDA